MDAHDPAMFPMRVAIVDPIESKDSGGGVVEDVPIPTVFPLACYIYTTDTQSAYATEAILEQGNTTARIFFPERPTPDPKRGDRVFRQSDLRQFRVKGRGEFRGENLFIVNAAASE